MWRQGRTRNIDKVSDLHNCCVYDSYRIVDYLREGHIGFCFVLLVFVFFV